MNAALDWFYTHPWHVIAALMLSAGGLIALIVVAIHLADDRAIRRYYAGIDRHHNVVTHLDPARRAR